MCTNSYEIRRQAIRRSTDEHLTTELAGKHCEELQNCFVTVGYPRTVQMRVNRWLAEKVKRNTLSLNDQFTFAERFQFGPTARIASAGYLAMTFLRSGWLVTSLGEKAS